MRAEDVRSDMQRTEKLYLDLVAKNAYTNRELTFVARKYIMHVIYRGWMKARLENSHRKLKENNSIIASQRLILKQHEEDFTLLREYKKQAELEIKELKEEVCEKQIQLSVAMATSQSFKADIEQLKDRI